MTKTKMEKEEVRTLNFEGYPVKQLQFINMKIVQEIFRLKEKERLKLKLSDGEIILEKVSHKILKNENKS